MEKFLIRIQGAAGLQSGDQVFYSGGLIFADSGEAALARDDDRP
jgi:hypothetical protein